MTAFDVTLSCSRCVTQISASILAPTGREAIERLLGDAREHGWWLSTSRTANVRHYKYEDHDEDLCPACAVAAGVVPGE